VTAISGGWQIAHEGGIDQVFGIENILFADGQRSTAATNWYL